ncbi:hypothetical protein RclHR1_15260009 [Rhizophagus clarus]|uniref:Uncharacterized protein n=1 Tax=Rhizophagus clarus TaxID=94130 RepID=A0A2Z6QS70_9GLOM|nr:hypothetical protein RclHR1_15260009 [Rhizophagus clarus]GES97291.1 hypothetical protein GLOIN_2v1598901 [Rhizophagus clarus]
MTDMATTNDNNSSLSPTDVDGSSNQHSDHQLSESNDHNSNNSTSSSNQQNNVLTSNEFDNAETGIENDNIQETSEKNNNLDEILQLKQKINEQKETIINQTTVIIGLQGYNKKLEDTSTRLKQRLKDTLLQVQSLKERNTELENEASNYQQALGAATNFKMSDDDRNHNVQLYEDILSLQDKIESYVTNLGKLNAEIKIDEVKKLPPRYGCQTKIDPFNLDKQFIKAILRRHVLETIFEFAEDFFSNNNEENYYLESVVVKKTGELSGLMEKFSSTRDGTDEIAKVTPTKLRQLIYAALGTRGFGDINESDVNFITNKFTENLNKSINQYRVIIDPKKNETVDRLAKILIQEVIRIFYFRLKIQEPMAQHHWFKCGDKVSKTSMDANWDDDEIDELVVELCTFPLIYQDINSNRIVFTPAKVFTRHVPLSNILQNDGMTLSNNSVNSDQTESPNNDFDVQNVTNDISSDEPSEYETGEENDEKDEGTKTTDTVETPPIEND